MPTAEVFQTAVCAIGTTSFDQVVIYDRSNPLAASILWRLFQAFGHRDACVLDGGYQAWCAATGELAAHYAEHEPGTWRAERLPDDGELLAEIQQLRDALRIG